MKKENTSTREEQDKLRKEVFNMHLKLTKQDLKTLAALLDKEADSVSKDITLDYVDKEECLNYIAYLKSLSKYLDKKSK
jgi:hypothetical protein